MPEFNAESSDDDDYLSSTDDEAEKPAESKKEEKKQKAKPVKIEIDLSLTAYGNAQRYYNMKRQAASKEQRTMDASEKVTMPRESPRVLKASAFELR